ncbi:MAG TPA: hypothetical protein VIC84_11500 [Blastocatellia bacterium]|jgi:hypothetical protein
MMKIFMNSQVRGYQKFMADKNVHSWCGIGSQSPIPTAGGDAESKIVAGTGGNDSATDENGGGSRAMPGARRSSP